jgi:hypothetical protein
MNWSRRRKMQAGLILAVVILLVPSFLTVYRVPSYVHIERPPVYWTDVTSDQHVVEYHRVIEDENITVGEMGLTWDIWFVSEEDEDYDYYELRIHHFVSGAPGDGLIKSGESFLELNSVNQSIDSCSEEHGTGAVESNLISNVSWGGNILLSFDVLPGSGEFRPQSASNVVTLNVIVRTRPNARLDFSLIFSSEWFLDYHGWWHFLWTETLFISLSRDIMRRLVW